MAKKVTMQQIADYLGVSKYVVSKALSGKEGVNESTRSKVIDTASQLGYFAQKNSKVSSIKLSNASKTNRLKEEGNVLVLMPNIRYQTMESSYWGGIVDGISSGLEKLGYGAVVVTETNVKVLSNILNPTGFLGVISVGVVSSNLLLEVQKMNTPIVMVDYEDLLLPCDTLFNNNFDGSMNLVNYLMGIGHTKIQYVGDIHYSRSFYDRWLGLKSVLEMKGILNELDTELMNLDIFKVEEQFYQWLSKNRGQDTFPTAFVCANDNIAARVVSVLTNAGVRIPEDVSVAGFDNKEFTYKQSPTITTINVAKEDMGKRAVEMLMRRIEEKDAPFEKVMLAGEIMLRESTSGVIS
ncbi:LacI family DNA-binding transcriptional regulator [Aquibacillus kalidii]|uniref:LacI family DNA-binding transcriptional regulator n=1 Tax=Aquibacillus kalidii TaxID=2762597 RepID=UPI001646A5D7|nr:LacI family DNA-binding transcriptional regulator [Aquibacillus kalidii]